MNLEDIVKKYGWNDYFDMVGFKLYKLSQAVEDGERILVPVIDYVTDIQVGYAVMKKLQVK